MMGLLVPHNDDKVIVSPVMVDIKLDYETPYGSLLEEE